MHDVFISYSRKDIEFARRFEKALRDYTPPKGLKPPARRLNVFRDEEDFTGAEYFTSLDRHLGESSKLLVICSPHARASRYVNDEIQRFANRQALENILSVLVAGIPNNEAVAGQEEQMAYPDALCEALGMPLSAPFLNFNAKKDRFNERRYLGSWHTLLANIYGLSRADLEQRERRRRVQSRRIRTAIAGSMSLALAVTVFFWRDSLKQKKLAEGATTAALSDRRKAEKEARAALSHQLAGAALNAEGSGTGILFALNALAVTRDADQTVLPGAEEALRQTVNAVHRAAAVPGTTLKRPGHTKMIRHIDFSSDGRRVATRGDDAVRVWDIAEQDEILSPPACWLLEFSRDGKRLACGDPQFPNFLDLDTGRKLLAQVAFPSPPPDFNPGRPANEQVGFSPDGQLMLWGKFNQTRIADAQSFNRQFPGGNPVFSPDGKMLATILDSAVKLWDVRSGIELHTWQGRSPTRVVFSGDGKRVAIGVGGEIEIWDLPSNNGVRLPVQAYDLRCLALNRDGTRLALHAVENREDVGLGIADTSGTTSFTLIRSRFPDGRKVYPSGCQFTPEGNLEVAYRRAIWPPDEEMYLWKLSRPEPSLVRRAHLIDTSLASVRIENPDSKTTILLPAQDSQKLQAVAFSADALRVVTSGSDGRARVWDTTVGRRLLTLVGHQQAIFTAAYSPDGNRIATAGLGPVAKIWDAHTGQFIRDLDSGWERILSVVFSEDSRRLLAAGRGKVIIWNAANGAEVTPATQTQGLDVSDASFSADGRLLALAGSEASLRDAVSLREVHRVPGHIQSAGGVGMSRDGQILAVAEPDGVHIWRQGSAWSLLRGSAGASGSSHITMAFSQDGRRLATPGVANTVRIWDTATAKESTTLYCDDKGVQIKGVAFSPDEKHIYAVGDNWTLFRFVTPLADLNEEARKLAFDANVSLSDQDCGKYLHQQRCPSQLRRTPQAF